MKNFSDLTERELLALAIALEEDSRTYSGLGEAMGKTYPGTARAFAVMADEENGLRRRLPRPLPREVRRPHPADLPAGREGLLERRSMWLLQPFGLERSVITRTFSNASSASCGVRDAIASLAI